MSSFQIAQTLKAFSSQEWSCEYQFDEIELDFDGVLIPSFSGTATLAENGGEFYVKAICLDGLKRDGFLAKPAKVWLKRPEGISSMFEAQIFRRIAWAIQSSPYAAEHFAQERAS